MANWIIQQYADLGEGINADQKRMDIMPIAYPGDDRAHVWQVTVTKNGEPFNVESGHTVEAYFFREYDGQSPMATGTITGNVCSVSLPQEAYAYPCRVTGIMRLSTSGSGEITTIGVISFHVGENLTGVIIDPGEAIPSIDNLLAEIGRLERNNSSFEELCESVQKYETVATIKPALHNYLLANVTESIVMNVTTSHGWQDLPINRPGVFENRRYSANFSLQQYRLFGNDERIEYLRTVDRRDGSVNSPWVMAYSSTVLGDLQERCQQYSDYLTPSEYSYLLANIVKPIILNVATNHGWLDLPVDKPGIFENRRYSSNYSIQQYRLFGGGDRAEYIRIVDRRDGSVFSDWVLCYSSKPQVSILAIGDSICRGLRNSGKGFVGDLGYTYINMGVGGATISSIFSTYSDSKHGFSEADNIPNQLLSYYNRPSSDIESAFGTAKFSPDLIIAEGGINDYIKDGEIGVLSEAPVHDDTSAGNLDRNTVLGALEYLFYKMIKLYPEAQRYFVITHRTFKTSTSLYYPTYIHHAGGYTQQDLHDRIIECCSHYGVIPIDVYKYGIMDTVFGEYRTSASRWQDASATDYCDADGVHPLSYGYRQVYVPLVQQAIANATKK